MDLDSVEIQEVQNGWIVKQRKQTLLGTDLFNEAVFTSRRSLKIFLNRWIETSWSRPNGVRAEHGQAAASNGPAGSEVQVRPSVSNG